MVSEFCRSHGPWSDEYFKCVAKNAPFTVYHSVGTCKMGPPKDEMAVVDPTLKVIGIQNLRVIDSSIMPKIVGSNTNAATVMIGEKGADMIIKDYSMQNTYEKNTRDEL